MTSAVTKLATISPGGTAVGSFTSISGAYDDLKIIGTSKQTGTSSTQNRLTADVYIRFNSDSGSNYNTVYMYADSGSGSVFVAVDCFSSNSGYASMLVPGSPHSYNSSTVGWGGFEIDIFGYTDTTANLGKQIRTRGAWDFGSASFPFMGTQISNNTWDVASAITQIDINAIYTGFTSGTTFTLYGIKNT